MTRRHALPPVVIVTGTDTDVGKTVVTAALAAWFQNHGDTVTVCKPVQTGVGDGEPGDVHTVGALTGITNLAEGGRYRDPMAPRAAAARESRTLESITVHADRARHLADTGHRVVLEGAGGLLVELDDERHTLLDLASLLGPLAGVVVVCRPGLGTLNHTALTLAALRHRGVRTLGTVLGAWPEAPSQIELDNRAELACGRGAFAGVPLLGAVPAGIGARREAPGRFAVRVASWLPGLGDGIIG